MSGESRLDRLYPALTATERALLALQAIKTDSQPDPALRRTMPDQQRAEYYRLIRLINAINAELTYVIMIVSEQVRHIDLKYGWLMSLVLWGSEVDVLGESLLARTKDRQVRSDVRKLMKRAPGAIMVPVDLTSSDDDRDVFKEGFGARMVRALLIGITNSLQQHWVELRSIEIAIEEQMFEFGGEDPLRGDGRERLDTARDTCATVHEAIQLYIEPFALSEPTEDEVELVRRLIEQAAGG